MRCILCGKIEPRLTKHHYFHPKRNHSSKAERRVQVKLCSKDHREFHQFFDIHCRRKVSYCDCCYFLRICVKGGEYENVRLENKAHLQNLSTV